MLLHRRAQKWLDLDATLTDGRTGLAITGASYEATFDGGLTWIDADTSAGGYRWMLRGPLYKPDEAGMPAVPPGVTVVTIAANLTYTVRAIAAPEVEPWTGQVRLVG